MKCAFVDRDGTIGVSPPEGEYILSWEAFRFEDRAKEALKLLADDGWKVVVITNQRAVARGLLSIEELETIHEQMNAELAAAGVRVDGIYYCPHETDRCDCRKPKPGLLLRAQKDFPQIDFAESVVIGDSMADVEAGQRVGCFAILVGRNEGMRGSNTADVVLPALWDAAEWIHQNPSLKA